MNAETSDRRNSRLTLELLILSTFENIVTELKCVRCQNSRCMSELPTIGTPDVCRNFRPSELPTYVGTPDPHGIWKLAFGLWSSIPDTSGMTTTVNTLFQLNCETSELPTFVGTPDEPTREQQFLQLLGEYRTRPVLPDQQKQSKLFCRSNTQNSHGLA